jgi:hypothetical protein
MLRHPELDEATVAVLVSDLMARGLVRDPAVGTFLAMEGDQRFFALSRSGSEFVAFLKRIDSAGASAPPSSSKP